MLASFFDSLGKLIVWFFFIVLLIILLFRIFGKFFLRLILKRFSRKMHRQYTSNQKTNTANEGKTSIAYTPSSSSTSKDNSGEYIDYEEID